MANKIQVTLDTAKLKGLATERTYKNREGEEITIKELKFELVEVKEPKVTYSTDKYDLVKTHFAAAVQTKEEREAKAPAVYVGEGIVTVWKNSGQSDAGAVTAPSTTPAPATQDDCPF